MDVTAHAHYSLGRKKKIKDNEIGRTRLALHPGISKFPHRPAPEDLSEGLRNYVRANTWPQVERRRGQFSVRIREAQTGMFRGMLAQAPSRKIVQVPSVEVEK